MAMIAVWLKIDGERLVPTLQEAADKLDSADGEVVLDFSSVRRIHPGALSALEKLANAADSKSVKVGLRGVNVEVYRVLKLVKMAARFSFLN
jgi:anti-anti-sigma regulatory factor